MQIHMCTVYQPGTQSTTKARKTNRSLNDCSKNLLTNTLRSIVEYNMHEK